MKQFLRMIFILTLLTACAPTATSAPAEATASSLLEPAPTRGSDSAPEAASPTEAESNVDILANLPAPVCDSGPTPEQGEGPYYLAGTPERTSLIEADTQGEKLIVVGYVVNQDCFPIPHAWLDFWQADANGEYDLTGFTMRGFQFSDNKGRFYLETVLPGLYESRPIRHIHVKVQAPNGPVLITQLYFPEQPIAGLTVILEQREGFWLGIFTFVLNV